MKRLDQNLPPFGRPAGKQPFDQRTHAGHRQPDRSLPHQRRRRPEHVIADVVDEHRQPAGCAGGGWHSRGPSTQQGERHHRPGHGADVEAVDDRPHQ